MKRIALFLLSLLLLTAMPALAELVDTLPIPEDCKPMFNYIGENSTSYLDFSARPDPFLGWVGEETAMFTENTPEGRIFAGYVRTDDGWLRTASTPLPEGAAVNHAMTSGDLFYFDYPHPQGLTDEDGRTVWINAVVRLEEDGVWRLVLTGPGNGFHFTFDADGLYVQLQGLIYGPCAIDRDIRTLDWTTFPLDWKALLPLMSDEYGIIGVDTQRLHTSTGLPLADYHYGTPVTVLAREGGVVHVRIADSSVTGWLPASSLLLGAAQAIPHRTLPRLIPASSYAPQIVTRTGVSLYDAPEGSVIATVDEEWLNMMSDTFVGWYHACYPATNCSVWLRAEDAVTSAEYTEAWRAAREADSAESAPTD